MAAGSTNGTAVSVPRWPSLYDSLRENLDEIHRSVLNTINQRAADRFTGQQANDLREAIYHDIRLLETSLMGLHTELAEMRFLLLQAINSDAGAHPKPRYN